MEREFVSGKYTGQSFDQVYKVYPEYLANLDYFNRNNPDHVAWKIYVNSKKQERYDTKPSQEERYNVTSYVSTHEGYFLNLIRNTEIIHTKGNASRRYLNDIIPRNLRGTFIDLVIRHILSDKFEERRIDDLSHRCFPKSFEAKFKEEANDKWLSSALAIVTELESSDDVDWDCSDNDKIYTFDVLSTHLIQCMNRCSAEQDTMKVLGDLFDLAIGIDICWCRYDTLKHLKYDEFELDEFEQLRDEVSNLMGGNKIDINPAIGANGLRGDCDLIVDDKMIDIKCYSTETSKDTFAQLIVYSALAGLHGYNITKMCVYNPLTGDWSEMMYDPIDEDEIRGDGSERSD